MKTQQGYVLKEEISINRKKIGVLLYNLRNFPKSYEQTTNATQIA